MTMAAPRPSPIAAKDTTAAKLLDMPLRDFRRLVSHGALPPPVRIGEHERWRVADIEAILTGSAMDEEFET